MEWTRGPIIGRGSTATVSLATSTASSGKLFALKSSELSKSMLLQKEQCFLSKLNSPYVVKYIGCDISRENDKPMYNICMEYVSGGTLHEVILRNGGKLEEAMIRLHTRNILQGLEYLHGIGLAHCDIKSHNILVSKEGLAKIADFGCARFIKEIDSGKSAFAGTPAFMAPEVARGEEQGFEADVWSVGCTIIEMATGRIPWMTLDQENDDVISVLYKIGFSSDLPEIPEWLSEKTKDFLSKCLRRDPKERWTVKELLDHPFLDELEIKKFEDHLTSSTSSPSCVLDQDFWDSMEVLEGPQDLTFQDISNSNSPANRIKNLIGSISDLPSWSFEEDWITVRSRDIENIEMPLVSNTFLISDSIVYNQELERSIETKSIKLLNSLQLALMGPIESTRVDRDLVFHNGW
ncbi:hypothetical protein JCGZ_00915 [Jatropha curcas]|uniref:Protein kinase domain-containing protein n=1 Tax=Jatropha curcas TaxID=180498 RepID=A0A067KW07_JATCU|nr:hypothetical protein JCGZ_00915 [Jatropha curcas]